MDEACLVCSRETKYKCIKYDSSVCALCVPETAQTVREVNYCPRRRVGFCVKCQERIEETTDVTLASICFQQARSWNPRSWLLKNLNQQTKAHLQLKSLRLFKRKQWTREQKLEFVDMHKKFKNKAKAVREL